jgi:AcrR family transcriptional regulator
MSKPTRTRRRYDSPLRRQQAAETRERIIAAGAALLHEYPVWNWDALTVRAVAKRARVNERTVYRHFANEGELREAVMGRHQKEAGVDLDRLSLENLREITARVWTYVSTFPLEPRTPGDPTLMAAGKRQRDSLLAAVAPLTGDWDEGDRAIAAAMLDVLWGVAAYERLVSAWALDPKDAISAVTWVMGLVEEAIRSGRRPEHWGAPRSEPWS